MVFSSRRPFPAGQKFDFIGQDLSVEVESPDLMGQFMRWGFEIGSLLGIRVKVHWTCLILLAYYLKVTLPDGFGVIDLWILAIVVGTILLHELGHCLAARSNGGEAYEIILWPLGGLALTAGGRQTPRDFVWVALAGPLTHVPLSLACVLVLAQAGHPPGLSDFNPLGEWSFPRQGVALNLVYFAFKVQVILFCLNMLPAYPLDGGQILLGLLSASHEHASAAFVTAGTTVATALVLLLVGVEFLPLWLLLEAWSLAGARSGPAVGTPPPTRVFRRFDPGAALPRSETDLRPCPHCSGLIHCRAERCVHCDRVTNPG